jgi:endonuclease/exonuclease/phosphatase family metal-dependent hydrolase
MTIVSIVFVEAPREAEASAMRDVYRYGLTKLEKIDEKSKHVVILGDFNLEPENAAWSTLRGDGLTPAIVMPAKTTVGSVSLYDNIWIDDTLAKRSFQVWWCFVLFLKIAFSLS